MPNVELTQEQVDELAAHLEEQEIYKPALANVLKKLPDFKSGSGELPNDFGVYCVLCDEQITDGEEFGRKYGKFCHKKCIDNLEEESPHPEENVSE